MLRGRVGSLLEVGTGFHPELTGRENVYLNGAILGHAHATEIRRKFDDDRRLRRGSSVPRHAGEALLERHVCCAWRSPSPRTSSREILLVDEVLAVGDAAFQKKCLGKMGTSAAAGRTVLFVSHNMAAVSALCTRAIVLEAGRPVFDGAARDGVRRYLENNLADSALTWDLATTSGMVADLGSLVRLERVTALTARGDGFRFAEPLRFRVGVASTATLEHLECAIGLDDMFGSRVVTFMSDRQQMSTTAGGRYDIDVTVPPFGLRPGRYMLSVSLYSGGATTTTACTSAPFRSSRCTMTAKVTWTTSRIAVQSPWPPSGGCLRRRQACSCDVDALCVVGAGRALGEERSRPSAVGAAPIESRLCRSVRTLVSVRAPHRRPIRLSPVGLPVEASASS